MNQARDLMRANPPDYEKALDVAQQATQVGANYDLTWGVLGDAQFGNKHYQEAVDAFQKAIQMNSASAKPNLQAQSVWNHNMGRALIRLHKNADAQAAFDAAAKDQPATAAKDYYTEGAEFLNSGSVDEAVAAFDKAISADPTYADAYFQKGITLMNKATMQGNKLVAPAGTEEALQKYLELAPNGPNAANATEVLQTLGAKVKTTYKK
jgi:tetratricopeptide (TPR) repeat protein